MSRRPNVVILAIDTLRPDHLGCYGYHKPTSPNIDALASESVVFDRAFAAAIPTMPSFTTMLSGLHPYRHGIVSHIGERQQLDAHIQLLPQIAQKAGWITAGIDNLVVQGQGRGSWFARGFDYYSGFLYAPFTNQSEQLTNRAIRFIDEFGDKPFLLYCHLWDPHTPYGPPPPFDTMHYEPGKSEDIPDLKEVIALSPEYYEAFLGEMNLRHPDDYSYVIAQYDGEISYVDVQIGRLIAHLKACGQWENTIFLLMSDHGEAFGEGDIYFDHHGLYDAVIRVALMCRAPGSTPARCNAMVSTEDIFPTLAEWCGWELPAAYPLTGQSFGSALRGETLAGRERHIAVESTRQASLCIRTDKWKLIQPVVTDANGQPLPNIYGQPRDPAPLLFDLETDPTESQDVSAQFPDIRDTLLEELNAWRSTEVTARGGSDPVLENGLSLSYDVFMSRLNARRHKGKT
jgi:arylsulfatase A-like enzyme